MIRVHVQRTPLIIYAGQDTVVDNDFGREWLSRVFPDREEVEIEGGRPSIA